ncbi:hypothetical protein BDV25DRAFT_161145 [Aspergillus avenaceus]|uniref:Rhodopsin domain-containing protein n=1 Tax=Aspergillus avenaceus TaxID=36643 RepID=A0A5N6TL51_ASPAV|nr:hypothetical protein BDV25DRAFT_161145 [Aspergillus avenaceus]
MTLLRITVIRPHTIILYLVSGLTILVGGMFVLVSVFECTPVDFFWNRQTKTGKCVQPIALVGIAYAASVIAAIADFTLGLMPIFIVWNLQMNRKTKVALAGIMGMGCLYVLPTSSPPPLSYPLLTQHTAPAPPSSPASHTCPLTNTKTSCTPPTPCRSARTSKPG